MTFLQCVHGVYDEKMEAVYRKSSRKGSFGEDTESTLLCTLGIFYSEDSGNALFRFFVNLFFFSLILLLACFIFAFLVSAFAVLHRLLICVFLFFFLNKSTTLSVIMEELIHLLCSPFIHGIHLCQLFYRCIADFF